MEVGYLRVKTIMARGAVPIGGAEVIVKDDFGNTLHRAYTNNAGETESLMLYAPDKNLSLCEGFLGVPYATYRVEVRAEGFVTEIRNGVQIFDTMEALEEIYMTPNFLGLDLIHEIDIPPHKLVWRH